MGSHQPFPQFVKEGSCSLVHVRRTRPHLQIAQFAVRTWVLSSSLVLASQDLTSHVWFHSTPERNTIQWIRSAIVRTYILIWQRLISWHPQGWGWTGQRRCACTPCLVLPNIQISTVGCSFQTHQWSISRMRILPTPFLELKWIHGFWCNSWLACERHFLQRRWCSRMHWTSKIAYDTCNIPICNILWIASTTTQQEPQ